MRHETYTRERFLPSLERIGKCVQQIDRPHGVAVACSFGVRRELGAGGREAEGCDPFRGREVFLAEPKTSMFQLAAGD